MHTHTEILVVEDSPSQAEHLQSMLQAHGYAVVLATDGKEALATLQQKKPSLIISDVIMPVMAGYALCQAIKRGKALSDIPVVLVTALANPEDIIQGLECGADSFLVKPYDEHYLLSRIEYLLVCQRLHSNDRVNMSVEVHVAGKRHVIDTKKQQILTLLVATFEDAVRQNRQLQQTQQELQVLNEQLEARVQERTQELTRAYTELEQFVSVVSHEFQTLLGIVTKCMALLTKDYRDKLDTEVQKYITQIANSSFHMQALLQKLF